MGLGNLLLACFWRWKIYQVETYSLSGRTSFVRFFSSFFFAKDNGREISRYPFVFETINIYGNIFQPVYSRCYPLSNCIN